MAEDKGKRKSSRHFDLDKPAKRKFNLEKDSECIGATPARTKPQVDQTATTKPVAGQTKKPNCNFNLNKDSEETTKPTVHPSALSGKKVGSIDSDSNNRKGNGKKWIAAAVIAVALIAGGLVWHNLSKGGSEAPEKTYVANDTTAKSPSDSSLTPGGTADKNTTSSGDNGSNTGTGAVENDNSAAYSDNPVPSEQAASMASPAQPSAETLPKGSTHELAMKVWDDAFGFGAERKAKLGSRYREVQAEVNRMYRNGYRPNK
jgi:hypothetical protein